MLESTKMIIFLINLLSLIIGGISLGLIYNLSKRNNILYLNSYFFFLLFAVLTGFCDWIIFNWIRMLVPDLSLGTADIIYHIFWDLIGFPSLLFMFFYLTKATNRMLKLEQIRIKNIIFLGSVIVLIILAYIAFYFRIMDIPNFLIKSIWTVYTYIIPLSIICYLCFAYYKSTKVKGTAFPVGKFIIILILGFIIWIFLSLVPIRMGVWRHIIIFSYYLAIFLPTIYLFTQHKNLRVSISDNNDLNDIFNYHNFTSREKELAHLLLDGKSNQEISEALFVSLQTVKNYVSNIYKKVGLKNRVQFVNFIREKSTPLKPEE